MNFTFVEFLRMKKKIPRATQLKMRIITHFYLFKIAKNWVILNRISTRLRPAIWRKTGCTVGKNVSMGYDIYYDVHNASLITVEERRVGCQQKLNTLPQTGPNDVPQR